MIGFVRCFLNRQGSLQERRRFRSSTQSVQNKRVRLQTKTNANVIVREHLFR